MFTFGSHFSLIHSISCLSRRRTLGRH